MSSDSEGSPRPKRRRGFAAMSQELKTAIASQGGKSHSREHMARIGRVGGQSRRPRGPLSRPSPPATVPAEPLTCAPPESVPFTRVLTAAARELQAVWEEYALTRVSHRMYQRRLTQLAAELPEPFGHPRSRQALAECAELVDGAASPGGAQGMGMTPAPEILPRPKSQLRRPARERSPGLPEPPALKARDLAYYFKRNGVVRRSPVRHSSHKGQEVRLVAFGLVELEEIRRLLQEAGFVLAAWFQKRRRYVQPIYGQQVARFLERVGYVAPQD